ncbi:STAS domain-containing protein [Nostoc parmelioides]|uniref:Anti-sigma factor antagonist n=1 Tax=Nostoc parmelioides FACHB-3921 TaxID=2692909 RepID=A0ABR8B7A2_9NOSO|nr:STAS domain-containing protein [Nostoc parmelioides]MBD2249845.1 STAS domain-containing protein [Nostoc parmelioides FACHB-3921]
MYSNVNMKIIQPSGFFDGRKGRQIHEEISKNITSDITTFLIDFQSVTFMDSSGFGTLLLTLKTVRQKKVRLALCSINEQIKMILELSDTSKVFEVFPDQAAFMETITQY